MSDTTEIKVKTNDLLSVADAAKKLKLARYTIYRWASTGKIIGIRLGGVLFIPKSEIERLKKEREGSNAKGE
jgi:excisionase family DNA binding protein